jgi:phenylacetate-CoA ligase
MLTGYGSYIGALLRWAYLQRQELHRPKAILYGADCMPESDRLLIEHELGVPVLSSYQSVEGLRIAFQCEKRDGFHVDADQVVLRIVDAAGAAQPPGVPGEVVISNLTNRATVLLNYRQGDIAALSANPCPCGRNLPMLDSIQGREDDLVRLPGGSVAHPLALTAVLQRVAGVVQVQLVQEELRRFRLLSVCAPSVNWPEVAFRLQGAIRSLLGDDTQVTVERHDRIPPDPSGKTRAVISRCRD